MHVLTQSLSTVRGGDVGDKGCDMRKGLDGVKVDTDDERAFRHVLFSYLKPTTRSSTQIDTASRFGEEVILAVEVDKFAV